MQETEQNYGVTSSMYRICINKTIYFKNICKWAY